jgi:hypothetical protein
VTESAISGEVSKPAGFRFNLIGWFSNMNRKNHSAAEMMVKNGHSADQYLVCFVQEKRLQTVNREHLCQPVFNLLPSFTK